MGVARIAILVVAALAAGIAALLVRGLISDSNKATANTPEQIIQMPTSMVLVATSNLDRGQRVTPGSLRWQPWPEDAISPNYISKSREPRALEDIIGSTIRISMEAGEPVTRYKIVSTGESGFMAAVLEPGMRAVSTRISPESGAGGFILPNDRVDVIVTQKQENEFGIAQTRSSTILQNIRVLAIDQMFRETDDKQVAIGKTATLELTPRQAEVLALSRAVGELSLSLRSLEDSGPQNTSVLEKDNTGYGSLRIIRYGSETNVAVGSAN